MNTDKHWLNILSEKTMDCAFFVSTTQLPESNKPPFRITHWCYASGYILFIAFELAWESMRNNLLDLYTDYLITSTSYTTATGLSKVLDNGLSHDQVTRFLKKEKLDNARLWTFIKPLVRSVEQKNSVLIVRGDAFPSPKDSFGGNPFGLAQAENPTNREYMPVESLEFPRGCLSKGIPSEKTRTIVQGLFIW